MPLATAVNQLQTAGAAKLLATLQRLFRVQAADAASRVSLGESEPDMSSWVSALVQACKPIILQMTQLGILQSRRRIADKLRGQNLLPTGDLRHHEPGNAAAFASRSWHGMIKAGPMFGWALPPYLPAVPRVGHVFSAPQQSPRLAASFAFDLFDPRVLDAVDAATFAFCRETMATAADDVATARAELRQAMREGLSTGEAQRELYRRTLDIFASPDRAFRIATTESSRAIHGGAYLSAKAAGAKKKEIVVSVDACDLCLEVADRGVIDIDEPFYIDKKGGPYAVVQYTPIHPHCMCSWSEVL